MGLRKIIFLVTAISMNSALVACIPNQDSGQESGTHMELAPDFDGRVVCNPFDMTESDEGTFKDFGLRGSIFYLTPEMPRFAKASEYIALGRKVIGISLFLNRLYVPTRPFNRGFVTQSGFTLETDNGDTLYEYFAIRMDSKLLLGENDTYVGNYQIALLADDGAVLRIKRPNSTEQEILINNDDVHPTRFKVATQPVYFDRSTRIPMEIQYFQGPRYHISLVMMWRPWPEDPNAVIDPLDGYMSNEEFFDSTQNPPTPQAKYNQLLSRGWRPLQYDNFLLDEGVQNPCGMAQ